MKKLLLATTALVAFAAGAQAADLGVPRSPVAAAVVAPAFNWTGFYVGAHLGYGWANSNWFTGVANTPINTNPRGIFGGLQAGYNWQINSFVLGLEGDLAIGGLTNSRICPGPTYTCTGRETFVGTFRGRVGVAADRALIYATGGLAVGTWNHRAALTANGSLVGGHASNVTRAGFALGGGLEYAFTPNVTAKVEYLYMHFGNYRAINQAGDFSSFAPRAHTVKIGLNYLFSTGPSAVVARY
jgi:outer membrane immunogenic protein